MRTNFWEKVGWFFSAATLTLFILGILTYNEAFAYAFIATTLLGIVSYALSELTWNRSNKEENNGS